MCFTSAPVMNEWMNDKTLRWRMSDLWGRWPLASALPQPWPVATRVSVSEDCCLSSFLWTSWSNDLDLLKLGLLLSFRGSESEADVMFSSWDEMRLEINPKFNSLWMHLNCLRLPGRSTCAWILFCFQNIFLQLSCKLLFELFVFCFESVFLRMAINPNLHDPDILLDDTWHTETGQREAHFELIVCPWLSQNILLIS